MTSEVELAMMPATSGHQRHPVVDRFGRRSHQFEIFASVQNVTFASAAAGGQTMDTIVNQPINLPPDQR